MVNDERIRELVDEAELLKARHQVDRRRYNIEMRRMERRTHTLLDRAADANTHYVSDHGCDYGAAGCRFLAPPHPSLHQRICVC